MSITTDAWATWPEGVIARYLTLAHATVDLRYDSGLLRATCGGERCPWQDHEDPEVSYTDSVAEKERKIDEVLPDLQPRAQAHAESCRALPRPGRP
ncbi:hypothetical protein ABT168_08870 [Streptomyces sp. NPDC001793]|uniref:hypothetical protein n=1 Tax=Streptomyces sp. NPDC001793 TaxID=3154657 RepID=UPI00331E96A7